MIRLVVLAAAALASGARSQEDWRWLDQRRAALLDELMPVPRDSRSLVVYRAYRDGYPAVPEAYFEIRDGETLEATVVLPLGQSAQQQLLDLHMADRAADVSALLTRVRVSRMELKASRCPAIQERLTQLAALRFGVPDRELIIVHPDRHRVFVDAGAGRLDATLQEDEHPLVQWCVETLRALQRCRDQ